MTAEDLEARAIDAARERYEDALRRAHRATAERIPPHYAAAGVTDPGVMDWVRGVAAAAQSNAGPGGIPVAGRGRSLLLSGTTGTGKTWHAYGAMRALGEFGVIASWTLVTAADLYAALRPRPGIDSEAEFRGAARVPVLIIDDLGAAKNSDWTEEVNNRLVNYRYEQQAVTIFTTNKPPSGLPLALGDRVASRLSEMAVTVVLRGPDRRLAK